MKSNIIILVISTLIVLSVHALEFLGYAPCDLCLKQRWAWYLIIIISSISLFFYKKIYPHSITLIAILFLGNSFFSGWHAGIEWGFWDGPETCSAISQSVNDHDAFLDEITSVNNFIPCNEAAIRIFGISLAGYNSFISLIMFIYSISILRKELWIKKE